MTTFFYVINIIDVFHERKTFNILTVLYRFSIYILFHELARISNEL